MLGQTGLDITNPDDKYRLKSPPADFSGLHLLTIMYVRFRQIDPSMDTGAYFGVENFAAFAMREKAWLPAQHGKPARTCRLSAD